ncbi:MAG: fibronectin type III-like domain-contianing protein [Mycobacteriales bacterium]
MPLDPGQTRTVYFDLHTDRFTFVGKDLAWTAEPATIHLHAGPSSTDLRTTATLHLTGPPRTAATASHLATPTTSSNATRPPHPVQAERVPLSPLAARPQSPNVSLCVLMVQHGVIANGPQQRLRECSTAGVRVHGLRRITARLARLVRRGA